MSSFRPAPHTIPFRLVFCTLGLAFLFAACSKSPSAVQWPALREMDAWAEKIEAWSDAGNIDALKKAQPDIKAAVAKLTSSEVPSNASQPKAIAQTLADLRDILKQLNQATPSDDDLKAQMAGLHPLVEKLMEQSGMPHVHDHDHDHAPAHDHSPSNDRKP